MTIPRTKIEELVARYSLEPSLVEIYVEGELDKKVLTWFIKESGSKQNIKIITPECIDVPDTLLQHYFLNIGSNRSRVIAIAKELYAKAPKARILCIADKDYDEYLSHPKHGEKKFVFTDYNSMDLYWLTPKIWEKIMMLSFGFSEEKSSLIFEKIIGILKKIFLLRLANESLKLGITFSDFCENKYINIDNDTFDFNLKKYLENNLKTNRKMAFFKDVQNEMAKFSHKLSSSLEANNIRGHDFYDLLHFYLKKKKTHIKINDSNSFQTAVLGCIEFQDLKETTLFKKIAEFL